MVSFNYQKYISFINKYNNFTQRFITGIFGALIIIFFLTFHKYTYFILFSLLLIFLQREYYSLVKLRGYTPLALIGIMIGLALHGLTFLYLIDAIPPEYFYFVFLLTTLLFITKIYKKNDRFPFMSLAQTFLGIVYIVIPICMLHVCSFYRGEYDWGISLGIFLILWSSETGAYIVGINFGKTKFFPRISPKKTWEGFWGGALFSYIMAFGISFFYVQIGIIDWLIIATIIIIKGTYGDLAESLFKRSLQTKDSGHALPGHGGFLDRFDGFLFSIPLISLYLKIFVK